MQSTSSEGVASASADTSSKPCTAGSMDPSTMQQDSSKASVEVVTAGNEEHSGESTLVQTPHRVADTDTIINRSTFPQNPIKGSVETDKDGCEGHEAQATSTRASSKTSQTGSMSPTMTNPQSSKASSQSMEVDSQVGEKRPARATQAKPPTSSGHTCRLRVATLGVSPSAGRGLGGPHTGFGAELNSVPTPIDTEFEFQSLPLRSTQVESLREPLPDKELPSINETLKELAPSSGQLQEASFQTNTERKPAGTLEMRQTVPELPGRYLQSDSSDPRNNPLAINPYLRRGDAIGPAHHIPGLGHLGELLTPPGWKIGDDPIHPIEARRLYDQSRMQAHKALDTSRNNLSNLSSIEQERQRAEDDERWQRQLKIDQICLAERVKISKQWREHQEAQAQLQLQQLIQAQTLAHPQPVHPPTETSICGHQRYLRSRMPGSPHIYAPSPPPSGSSLQNRLQRFQAELRFPTRSPMSPSFLDPNLIPQTLDSVYAWYRANKVLISQMQDENEYFLTAWTAKFGVPRPQGLPVTPMPPYMNGQNARPFSHIHHGYLQGQGDFDPTQVRLQDRSRSVPPVHAPAAKPPPFHAESLVPGYPNLRQEYFRTPSRLGRRPYGQPNNNEAYTLEGKVARGGIPQTQKAGPGRSVILPAPYEQQEPAKQKGRRGRRPLIDTKKGFAVPANAVQGLIAMGAGDATNLPPRAPAALACPAGLSAGAGSSAKATIDHSSPFNLKFKNGNSSSAAAMQRENSMSSSLSNAPSSDTPDDPKDTTFGIKAPRKNVTSRATAAPRKTSSTSKRRKSDATEPASTKKRVRLSDHGQADESAQIGEISKATPM